MLIKIKIILDGADLIKQSFKKDLKGFGQETVGGIKD